MASGSISIWMALEPIGGTCQKWVVMPPVLLPIKQIKSASLTTRFAEPREYVPTTPADNGWFAKNVSFPFREVATGILKDSANLSNWGPALECFTPPPETITGLSACCNKSRARSISFFSACGRKGGIELKRISVIGSRLPSSRSICPSLPWNCKCTGPGHPDTAFL